MRDQLEIAMNETRIVSFDRECYEEEDEIGCVVEVGDELFVIARVADTLNLDGYSVLRIEDVSQVEVPHEHEEFVASALRLRGESIDTAIEIDLEDWPSVVRSAGRRHEVVTLHTERTESGVCRIGRVRTANEELVSLIEIDPDADWYEQPSTVATADITRVDFGGAYEEALVLVGGTCPVPLLRPVD